MRKGAGISALSRHTAVSNSYSTLSTSISANQLEVLQQSLESFRLALIAFSTAHRADIRADPAFRHQFQKMCAALGVDPLAGGSKSSSSLGGGGGGWWSELIGIAEWEYELAVQVVDVCVSSRGENGGMIEMSDLIRRVERLRSGGLAAAASSSSSRSIGSSAALVDPKKSKSNVNSDLGKITPEDILRSLDILKPLGAGYTLHTPTLSSSFTSPSTSSPFNAVSSRLSGRHGSAKGSSVHTTYIRTIPRSLDTDQSILLALAASTGGRLRPREVKLQTGWSEERVRVRLDDCVLREGIGWVDEQATSSALVVGGSIAGDVWIIAATDFQEIE